MVERLGGGKEAMQERFLSLPLETAFSNTRTQVSLSIGRLESFY